MGLVALWHVGSSQTRDSIGVPCIARQILNQWTTMEAHIHSSLDFPPVEVPTEHWTEFPVLYSKFSLVIYLIHSTVYMSILIFQFIPPARPLLLWFKRENLVSTLFCNIPAHREWWEMSILIPNSEGGLGKRRRNGKKNSTSLEHLLIKCKPMAVSFQCMTKSTAN